MSHFVEISNALGARSSMNTAYIIVPTRGELRQVGTLKMRDWNLGDWKM